MFAAAILTVPESTTKETASAANKDTIFETVRSALLSPTSPDASTTAPTPPRLFAWRAQAQPSWSTTVASGEFPTATAISQAPISAPLALSATPNLSTGPPASSDRLETASSTTA